MIYTDGDEEYPTCRHTGPGRVVRLAAGRLIGTLLDAWEGVPNDERPAKLMRPFRAIYKAIDDGTLYATPAPTVPAAQYRAVVRAIDALARGDLRALGTVHEDIQASIDAIIAKTRTPAPRGEAVDDGTCTDGHPHRCGRCDRDIIERTAT